MSDWEYLVNSHGYTVGDDEAFDKILDSLSCGDELKENSFNIPKKTASDSQFEDIKKRILDQSYSYSYRNSHGKRGRVSGIFVEKYNGIIYVYIPLFNYFEQEITWLKADLSEPIKLSIKYSYNMNRIFNESEILQKLKDGYIQNFVVSKNTINKVDLDSLENEQSLYLLNEVLYTKGIYIVICFEVSNAKKWVLIPLEGALSTRGKNFLRTDEYGNNFSDMKYLQDDRYKTYKLKI